MRSVDSERRIRRTGIEALDTLAAMGQQADRSLAAMGQAILEEAAYLAQPNAEIWKQRRRTARLAGQAVVEYFTNDVATNHNRLRSAAERALDGLRRDPAGDLGRTAAAVLTNKAGTALSARCTVTVSRLKEVLEERARAEKAARRLKVILDNQRKQLAGPGTLCPVNPRGWKNACVPSSWADELNDEIGKPVFTADNFKWDAADDPTPWHRVYGGQKEIWGDRRFNGHDPTRAMLQSQGMPAIMPRGLDDITEELRAAGDGAGGFVTIFRQDGTAHMFRAKNFDGAVKFRDPALGTGGGYNFHPVFNRGALTRVDFYRTTGPDMLPKP